MSGGARLICFNWVPAFAGMSGGGDLSAIPSTVIPDARPYGRKTEMLGYRMAGYVSLTSTTLFILKLVLSYSLETRGDARRRHQSSYRKFRQNQLNARQCG